MRNLQALGVLAISTGALFFVGTVAAWILLPHGGATTNAAAQPDA